MTSDVEYLLLKEKGPYHDVYVRRRLNTNPGACKFYTIVISVISISLIVLLLSLVYVFVLVPSWQGSVLSWRRRTMQGVHTHVLTHTQCGPVEGVIEDGVYVFKGIPYALPPVGSRRWAKPQKLERETCWRGTYQAKQYGNMCTQPAGIDNQTSFTGDEDCLFINVWTQSLNPSDNLNVMFWIHGGFLIFGSGNDVTLMPTPDVTKSTGAVYVSINYRLGPMGFLTLDVLTKNSSTGTSGNYGMMDWILALQWVKDNIRNFGGDPNNVTVFGQSSGGTAIHALLASPQASGLFHRAWLASASAILNKTSAQASKENEVFLKRTGCASASCLRGLSAKDVMLGTPWKVFPYWAMEDQLGMPIKGRFDGALLVVDGYTLKEAPMHAWEHGRGNDVPAIFSTTAQEIDIQPIHLDVASWNWEHYARTVERELTSFSPAIANKALKLYPRQLNLTPEYQYTSLVSDMRVTCPIATLADLASRSFRSPVFEAVITSAPSAPINVFGLFNARYAFHGWDLIAFFGNFKILKFQPTKKDLLFQQMLREQIMAFARADRPRSPEWKTAQYCTALLSDTLSTVDRYHKERCQFWIDNDFFSYAWIN